MPLRGGMYTPRRPTSLRTCSARSRRSRVKRIAWIVSSGSMIATRSVGPNAFEDDAREILARAQRADERVDVVLVPEDQEHAHVVARRLDRGVSRVPDLQRHVVVGRLPRRLDELEGGDLLELAVVAHLEIGGRQGGHRTPAAIEDRDVHAHEIGAGPEGRRLLGRRILQARAQRDRERGDKSRDRSHATQPRPGRNDMSLRSV